jgi:hypothetical protein
MKKYCIALGFAFAIAGFIPVSPAMADTCSGHYAACIRYNHGEAKCGCARSVCLKAIGPTKDVSPKWNGIPGINACFAK